MTIDERLGARRSRVAAASVVAIVAVVVAATGHALAGGGMATLPTLLVALVLGVPLGALIVGTRGSTARLAVGVAVDQAIFHAVFAFFGAESSPAGARAAAHELHGAHVLSAHALSAHALSAHDLSAHEHATALTHLATPAGTAGGMLAAHLVAGLVAMAAVAHGRAALDSALGSLARAIVRAVSAPRLDIATDLPARPAHPATERRVATRTRPRARAITRRGPPVLV